MNHVKELKKIVLSSLKQSVMAFAVIVIIALISAIGVLGEGENNSTVIGIGVSTSAYLPMDGSGNDVMGINHCKLNSTVATTGIDDAAYYFDGASDFMECTNNNIFTSNLSNMAFCLSLRNNLTYPNRNARFFHVNNTANSARQHEFRDSNSAGKYTFTIKNSTGSDNSFITGLTPLAGVWSRFCYAITDSTPTLYHNGTAINTTTTKRDFGATLATNWYLGGRLGTQSDYNGTIDEVAFYTTALTSSQVLREYTDLHTFGVKSYDTLNTSSHINVTEVTKTSIYVCHQLPAVDYWNTSRFCYNSSVNPVLTCTDSATSCLNLTGLTASILYKAMVFEVADNGINTTTSAFIYNATTTSASSYYYAKNGTDANDCLTPATPCQTTSKANSFTYYGGDALFFQCGDLWNFANETRLTMPSGGNGNYVTINNYGNCLRDINNYTVNKPRFTMANYTANSACWTSIGGNIWQWGCGTPPQQIARVIGNVSQNISQKPSSTELVYKWNITSLTSQGDYFSNETSKALYIYSTSNPVTYYGSLLLAYRNRIFYDAGGTNWLYVANVSIEYTADHGLDFENNVHDIVVRETDCSNIGGGFFKRETVDNPNERYGNCYQIYRNSSNILFDKNRCWETYDACYTNQASDSASLTFGQVNITYQNNLCYNSAYCYEFFQSDLTSYAQNITYKSNTGYNAGLGWYRPQRVNAFGAGIYGRCIRIGTVRNVTDLKMYDNLCQEADQYAFGHPSTITNRTGVNVVSVIASDYVYWFDYNLYYRNISASYSRSNYLIAWGSGTYFSTIDDFMAGLGKELHSRNESTTFNDVSTMDFRPVADSLACSMSSTASYVGAYPCTGAADVPPGVVTSLAAYFVNQSQISLSWINPTDADFDHVEVWANGVFLTNTAGTQYNSTGLTEVTFYNHTVVPVDTGSNRGINRTVANTTTELSDDPLHPRRFTGYSPIINISVNGGDVFRNITFLQRPYIVNAFMTVTNKNTSVVTSSANGSVSSCDGGVTNCAYGSDGTTATYAYRTSAGAFAYAYINYYNPGNQSKVNLTHFIDSSAYGGIVLECYTGSSWSQLWAGYPISGQKDIEVSSACLRSYVQTRVGMTYNFGGYVFLYDTYASYLYPYRIAVNSVNILEKYNEDSQTEVINFTSAAKEISSSVMLFNFSTKKYATFETNVSMDIIYNKSLNISVRAANATSVPLNPVCSFNGVTVYPYSGNLTFNSAYDNVLNCSLAGYSTITNNIYPENDNQTFLMAASSVVLNIYDEDTNRLILENLSVYVIRSDFAANYTVDTGNITIQNVPAGEIEIRYGGGNYVTRSYYTNVITDSSIDLYLLKSANASLIVFNVVDEKANPVGGAYLKAQRYFVEDNAWKLVSMEKTDTNGQGGMYLTAYNVPYIFIVEKDGRVVFTSSTSGTKIFSSTISFRVNLLEDVLESYYAYNKYITSSLGYDNATKTFTFMWNDASSLVVMGCLKVERFTTTGKDLFGPNCTNSASGTISIDITPFYQNNSRYRAVGYVETGARFSPVPAKILEIVSLNPIFNNLGKVGLFFGYILIITAFFIGLSIDLGTGIILAVLSMIILNMIGIALFGWAMIASVFVFGLVLSSIMEKK